MKKRFPTLAEFSVKRKIMRQDRHAGRETPERYEHSKNAENPFIAAPNFFGAGPDGSSAIYFGTRGCAGRVQRPRLE
jgi:hypothetical protein